MRTLIFVVGGFALWAVGQAVAKLVGSAALSPTTVTSLFAIAWFLAAAVNMWVGVYKAGYSFREELPIFCLIFLLPVIVAVLVNWKFL
jgi:hypothetical protein